MVPQHFQSEPPTGTLQWKPQVQRDFILKQYIAEQTLLWSTFG